MNLKIKAMMLLVIFAAILYLPFSLNAAHGNLFSGLHIPVLGGGGSEDQNSGGADQGNASIDEYAAGLPKPQVAVQVDMNYMRNHMVILKQPGHSTKECAACHTDRTVFCDRCHNFVGINPKIEY